MQYLADTHGFEIDKVCYNSDSTQIVISHLYSKDIPMCEQTEEIYSKEFPEEEIAEIEMLSEEANRKEYGDHAAFELKIKE